MASRQRLHDGPDTRDASGVVFEQLRVASMTSLLSRKSSFQRKSQAKVPVDSDPCQNRRMFFPISFPRKVHAKVLALYASEMIAMKSMWVVDFASQTPGLKPAPGLVTRTKSPKL
jgi:hypothetical protein